MKYLFLGLGLFLVFISLIALSQYIYDYDILSEYGKGYIWGKILVLIVGMVLTYFGIRKKSAG